MEEKPAPFTKAVKSAAPENSTHPQSLAHPPRPFKPKKAGQPERLNQSLNVDVLEWHHPIVRPRVAQELLPVRL